MELCVALDHEEFSKNIALAKELREFDIWMKVGFRSFLRDGRAIIDELKSINPNFKLFLDLKLYDIPNTMADAAQEIAKMGVDMFNIHASSGKKAMQTVMERLGEGDDRPLVLAVTALTSFDEDSFKEIYGDSIDAKAAQFAKEAYRVGVDGVVCSAFESRDIKLSTNDSFLTLTPGIRPFGESSDDQKRVADLNLAKEQSVDIIVVGRPIYKADKPREVVERILSNL